MNPNEYPRTFGRGWFGYHAASRITDFARFRLGGVYLMASHCAQDDAPALNTIRICGLSAVTPDGTKYWRYYSPGDLFAPALPGDGVELYAVHSFELGFGRTDYYEIDWPATARSVQPIRVEESVELILTAM